MVCPPAVRAETNARRNRAAEISVENRVPVESNATAVAVAADPKFHCIGTPAI